MKKTILIILLSVTNIAVFGQVRLGTNAADIATEFNENNYEQKSGYDKDNDYYISITLEKSYVTYYFTSDKVCNLTIIIPKNQGAINFYVENYNKQYVIVSSKQWKMYSESGIANIELIYPEGGGCFFRWSN